MSFLIRSLVIGLLLTTNLVFAAVEIQKSPNDDRQYRGLHLDNGLEVLLVSDPSAQKAAAALNVEVGRFNDPVDRGGMAHFTEHMLFLGTKKYPQPEEYSKYIAAYGGETNAYTAERNTEYYFSVLPDALDGALDRFAQFFIAPLFNAELVDRERHAVDSEYQLRIKNDGWRVKTADDLTANPAHPLVRFNFGSLATLGDDGKRRPVRDELIDFYHDYYSADQMYLAVIGPQSLNDLEAMVRKYFSEVPKHPVKPHDIKVLAYTPKETAKQIEVQSIGHYQEIGMTFPMPSQRENYTTKSLEYILYQFSQSGPGSLYKYLKQKGWILDITAASNDLTFNQSTANINISLTDLGAQHIDDIVAATFKYIQYLRQLGPQQALFDDLRLAGERNFEYTNKVNAADYAPALPEAMLRYPLAEVLIAGSFSNETKFDPAQINELWNYFTPQNMRLIVISNDVKGNQTDPYFHTSYKVSGFSAKQLDMWQQSANSKTADQDFALAGPNKYMPRNFDLIAVDKALDPDSPPKHVVNKPGLSLWFKPDQTFKLPYANITLVMRIPNAISTPKRDLLQEFMSYAINDRLSELGSQLSLAGVAVGVNNSVQGLNLSVGMFSDQQSLVIQDVLKCVTNYQIDPALFDKYKQDIVRSLRNFVQSEPFSQGFTYLNVLTQQPNWLPSDLLKVVDSVTVADVQSYAQEFLKNVQIEMLITGNTTQAAAEELLDTVAKLMPVSTAPSPALLLPQIAKVPAGSSFIYRFDPQHNDSVLIKYYQTAGKDLKSMATTALLAQILDKPLMQQLRTKEQLGYVVGSGMTKVRDQCGMVIYIESPTKTPNFINKRLSVFMNEFKQRLQTMSAEELNTHKNSLRDNWLEKPTSLGDEHSRFINKIVDQTYAFNLPQQLAEQVMTVSAQDLRNFFNASVDNKSQRIISLTTLGKGGDLPGAKAITSIAGFKKQFALSVK